MAHSTQHPLKNGTAAPAAATPLSDQERAELRRQGAKAAARGDPPSLNPLHQPQNRPAATGESQDTWCDRSDAWQQGHEAQRRVERVPVHNPKGEPGSREPD